MEQQGNYLHFSEQEVESASVPERIGITEAGQLHAKLIERAGHLTLELADQHHDSLNAGYGTVKKMHEELRAIGSVAGQLSTFLTPSQPELSFADQIENFLKEQTEGDA